MDRWNETDCSLFTFGLSLYFLIYLFIYVFVNVAAVILILHILFSFFFLLQLLLLLSVYFLFVVLAVIVVVAAAVANVIINPWSLGVSLMVQKMAISSSIPRLLRVNYDVITIISSSCRNS